MIPALPVPRALSAPRAAGLMVALFGFGGALSALGYFVARASGLVPAGPLTGPGSFLRDPVVAVALSSGAIVLTVYYGWRDSGLGWRELVPHRAPVRAYAAGLVLVAGTGCLISEGVNLLRAFVPLPPWMLRSTVEPGSMGPLQLIVESVLVAPLGEELLSRGIILRRLRVALGARKALAISSVLFALAHLYPVQVLGTFVMGLVLGWLYLRTNCLTVSIAGHALNNAIFAALVIADLRIPGLSTGLQPGVLQLQPWWLDALGVACLVAAWKLFRTLPPVESPALSPRLPVPAPDPGPAGPAA